MGDSTQLEPVTDLELVERVFDVVAALRDDVVEKYDDASSALRQLRARAEGNQLGPNGEEQSERLVYACPGCGAGTRGVSVAFRRGEACPICGLPADVMAAVSEARFRAAGLLGRAVSAEMHPLVSFLVARGREAVDGGDDAERAIAELVERVLGWPRRDDGRMWQRDVDLLRIAAAAYSLHPDYDPSWRPS